ncbi:MAG: DUF362 domain-containing protein [Spirochaetia bacterium]
MKVPVSLVRCAAYKPDELAKSLSEAIELAGGLELAGQRVLLKPNILRDAAPERALSTHPEFVRAVIRYVKAAGAKRILVGDSPGVHLGDFEGRGCGIRQVVDEEGAEWADFRTGKREFTLQKPLIESSFQLTKIMDQVDMVISLPKLKTHQFMFYTGAMKNLYGLIPGYAKAGLHVKYSSRDDFAKMLIDLLQVVKPHYALMDAVVAMEGPGPGNGFPRSLGLIAASRSTLALDLVASRLIGYDPHSIPTNRHALGVLDGINSVDDFELKGLSLHEARPGQFELIGGSQRGPVSRFLMRFRLFRKLETRSRPMPKFNHEKCIRCGECIAICASRALSFAADPDGQRYVKLDESKCIRCYCCHEICPVEAITIKEITCR